MLRLIRTTHCRTLKDTVEGTRMTGAVWLPTNGYRNPKTAPVWRIACSVEVKSLLHTRRALTDTAESG